VTYTIAVCTAKTPDDGQRNCPTHVEFHSKNKFEKLVHLVGFIIRKIHLHFHIDFHHALIRQKLSLPLLDLKTP